MLLIDENLSYKLVERLKAHFPGICCVSKLPELGGGSPDERVWAYAKKHNLAILTKDKDFVDFWKRLGPPPKVIRIDIGNCRFTALESHLRNSQVKIKKFLDADSLGLLVI